MHKESRGIDSKIVEKMTKTLMAYDDRASHQHFMSGIIRNINTRADLDRAIATHSKVVTEGDISWTVLDLPVILTSGGHRREASLALNKEYWMCNISAYGELIF